MTVAFFRRLRWRNNRDDAGTPPNAHGGVETNRARKAVERYRGRIATWCSMALLVVPVAGCGIFAIGAFGSLALVGTVHANEDVAAEVAPESDVSDLTEVEMPPAAATTSRHATLLASLTIFALAVFLGFELITKVPPTLHTPLMSGSNAISGITLVGAILVVGRSADSALIPLLGFLSVVMATVNVVGGFAVTHRMLSMFRRK